VEISLGLPGEVVTNKYEYTCSPCGMCEVHNVVYKNDDLPRANGCLERVQAYGHKTLKPPW